MMKIIRLRAALLVPVAVLAAACTDAMGPEQPVPTSASLASGPGRGPHFGEGGDVSVTEFTIKPYKDESFTIAGSHKLSVPARAVCDPQRSTYGPGTWNDPCELLTRPIKVTAYTSRDQTTGLPVVRFTPQLRFAPDKTVELRMRDRAVREGGWFNILYCEGDATPCVDESISDPTLQSFVIQKSGTVYRRIKHFSVYNMIAESWGSELAESY